MFTPMPATDHVSLAHDPGDHKSPTYFDDLTDPADRWDNE
jgi:hypothetical protein